MVSGRRFPFIGLLSPDLEFNIVGTRLVWGALGAFAILYIMFQKKIMPFAVSKIVSKILFYPTFPITVLNRLGNYWSPVDDNLFLGCAPMDILGIPGRIHKLGVRGVVNMCYEYPGPKDSYSRLGVKQLYLPSADHYEVSVEYMQQAVEFIKHHKERGEKVYVHCKAGHGRAASIALCWMIHENPSISPKDLNALLGKSRKVRKTLYDQKNIKAFVKSIR